MGAREWRRHRTVSLAVSIPALQRIGLRWFVSQTQSVDGKLVPLHRGVGVFAEMQDKSTLLVAKLTVPELWGDDWTWEHEMVNDVAGHEVIIRATQKS